MATEYKLSYTGAEINSKLGKVDEAVCYTSQTLTDAQKAQARANIGAASDGEVENFIITAIANADELTNISHTFEAIYEAHNAGQNIILHIQTPSGSVMKLPCTNIDADNAFFGTVTSIAGQNYINSAIIYSDDTSNYTSSVVGGVTDETDPTVPDWAKQPNKPTYTASEVGADTSGTADSAVSAHNMADDAHADIREKIEELSVFVTPQMYGAVGDGVTDDTAAFKNALAESNCLYVPNGTYLITDTLDISYKKSIVSDAGQRATILYGGNNNVVKIGRMSIFRNINITLQNEYSGTIFETKNDVTTSGEPALSSRVEHTNIDFEVASPNATLIGITVDSGTDPNNMPRLKGVCFQTYHDIHVDNSSEMYGYGIKMELVQGRAFTEESNTGFPWITHIDYDDISLGHPHTAIKAGVTNTSGSEYYERVNFGHILFNNIFAQYLDYESTQVFLDLDHFDGYFSKCKGWDYYPRTWDGLKVNIIGEGVTACFTDSSMAFGADFLKTCEFTAETEYTVEENPEYFMNKYFKGTVLSQGYDIIDAKIKAKLSDEYIGDIAEEKVNEVLYSGYTNILDDPLTQIKINLRFSASEQTWKDSFSNTTTVIVPIITGANLIRWSPQTYILNEAYVTMFFFNDDSLTTGVTVGSWKDLWTTDGDSGYLAVNNPSGYKYISIPFKLYDDISSETMTMTINREITGNEGQSYTEYLRNSVIIPAIDEKFEELLIPTKTSELENDSGYLTEHQSLSEYAKTSDIPTKTSDLTNDSGFITANDIPEAQVPDLSGYALKSSAETWTFTLSDGSTVTKKVVLA